MSAYAARADLCAAIHAHEDAEMLVTMHAELGRLGEYPVSGDMLAVVKHGTPHQRKRRRRAAARRRTER